jgi:putative PIN family toxin of toxin-antitoxin system
VRAVADTNIVISGLLWSGNPGRLLEAAANGEITLFTSPTLLLELSETLRSRKLFARIQASGLTIEEIQRRYLDVVLVVEPEIVYPVVPEDPDDDEVVAAAVAAQADLIISGDSHLLDLAQHAGIRIVTPAEAVRVMLGVR